MIDSTSVHLDLASCLISAINSRFAAMFDSADAQLAAVVNPKFKLDQIDNDVQRHELTDTLIKSRISVLATVSGQNQSCSVTVTAVSTQGSSGHRQPPDFFAALSARRHRATGSLNATQEVDKYLADTADTVASLDAYPHIRHMYIALNTGLPSSAAVERLFSLGGRVLPPMRSRSTQQCTF